MESVQVALRIRPLLESEINMGCQQCIQRIPNEPQVRVGNANHLYTFNYVFDEHEGQNKVYDMAVRQLLNKLFKGYNLTILAYGQTGSGKTFTMGTNYSGDGEMGVIPRVVYEIFDTIKTMDNYTFKVSVSFLELYNESLYDLLTNKTRECSVVEIREINNEICIPGLTEVEVNDAVSTLQMLNEGSLGRSVGATAMNAQSSRSHAIFTINIRIIPKDNPSGVMTSNFRLVDLAGSERSKKTGTTGDRFKEGVNINKGLLVLGNVISQLGEGNFNFVSYRDSKLTRLLQDSLGGNSVTLMIACVSPADYNQDETMSTLRYADRVKKIKNKPVVNQDPLTVEMCRLKKENEELRLKILHNSDCPPNHKYLETELEEARNKLKQFNDALTETLWSNAKMYEKAIMVEQFDENIKEKLEELSRLSNAVNNNESNNDLLSELTTKIKEVQTEYTKVGKEILKHEVQSERDSDADVIAGPSPTRQEYILSKAKINKEILTLNQNLMWKEELIAKYYENSDNNAVDVQNASIMVEDLKTQISELQREKEELMLQLTSSSSVSSKIAEKRRKRLQELEQKVTVLTKKINEQERVIKKKANSEEKIKTLKNDIAEMKKMKVRLIQQMKMGNDKFQSWKTMKNREMLALKNQNLKNQNELKKLEQIHSRQQVVFKRKLEAATAANKRLVAALERQKNARSRKLKGSSAPLIKEKITEELEMIESTYNAQTSLETLMQERAHLTKEFSDVKKRLEDPSIIEEQKIKLNEEKKQLSEELALRNTEIADLQQKLLDIIHDDPNLNEWGILQSMDNAKIAVSYLYSLLCEKMKDLIAKEHHLSDITEHYNDSRKEIENIKKELEQMRNNNCLNRRSDKHSENKSKREDKNQFEIADEESLRAFDDSLEIDCDNVENDPDWTKTPLYKKLQSLKSKRNQQNNNKCSCSGNCDKKCPCKKGKKSCHEQCSCNLNNCGNLQKVSLNDEERNDPNPQKRNSQEIWNHEERPRKLICIKKNKMKKMIIKKRSL